MREADLAGLTQAPVCSLWAAAWGCSGESKRVVVRGVVGADFESWLLGFKICRCSYFTFGSENFHNGK
jgi:hypothetical protein